MAKHFIAALNSWATRTITFLAATLVVLVAIVAVLLQNRPPLAEIGWPPAPAAEGVGRSVKLTWLGVTTLLFDDGDTQILIDGFFSRPSLAEIVLGLPVESDAAQINHVMDRYDMRRLAAIIPVHSHFDHAMDVGAIANRSSASIIGSETTAEIARGAGVPEDQIVVVADEDVYVFGDFSVRMIVSAHAPIGWGGSVPIAGELKEPLIPPAPIKSWKEGGSYSILIAHAEGTTLIQGSAGYVEGSMDDVRADVVMLGTFGLADFGSNYARKYWQTYVTTTGARRVFPIHFDDYTRPFGEIQPFPRILDDFAAAARLLENIRQVWDVDTRIYLPSFGKPMLLYSRPAPDA